MKAAFEKAAKSLFTVFSDCAESVTYKSAGSATYDPSTGTVTEAATAVSLKAISLSTNQRDRLGDHVNDARQLFLILAADLGVTPKIGDLIVVGTITKKVVDVLSDPIKCVWELGVSW